VARPLRLEVADGIYHVTARGNERRSIYRDDADRQSFLEILQATRTRFHWRCLGYCLMGNHYHLLVRTREPNLARGMRDLNGVYAQSFNRRHGRVGHLFQGRYRAIVVERDEHLLAAIAYVVRNPVRAGICTRPAAFAWSSHRAALGLRPPGVLDLGELLALLADDPTTARRRYRELVDERVEELAIDDGNGAIAGSEEFVRFHLQGVTSATDVPASQRRPPRPPLRDVLVSGDADAIARAYEHGYTMPAIAHVLGLHPSTVSRRLSRHRAQIKT
jgi:REP element-mobilizing transposase RayT